MRRLTVRERPRWRELAAEVGFNFHTIAGEPYWDESACFEFSLREIEQDIEAATAELEAMCIELVGRAMRDEEMLRRLAVPQAYWDWLRASWQKGERNLYGRMDLAYDGKDPPKLLEYNADTPTSLYESAFFQWVWLEEAMAQGIVPAGSDQFNSIQEHLIAALPKIAPGLPLHLTSARGSEEDRATVAYLEDCAQQAGLASRFLYIDEIGLGSEGSLRDLDQQPIRLLFKLYPLEWLIAEPFGQYLPASGCQLIEPPWKLVLSNKGILPLLWQMAPGHPNLLPACFSDQPGTVDLGSSWIRKPLFSREGENVELVDAGSPPPQTGPYGAEGHVLQAQTKLFQDGGRHAVLGSWLIASEPAGLGIREDTSPITRDTSRFVPHIISN